MATELEGDGERRDEVSIVSQTGRGRGRGSMKITFYFLLDLIVQQQLALGPRETKREKRKKDER